VQLNQRENHRPKYFHLNQEVDRKEILSVLGNNFTLQTTRRDFFFRSKDEKIRFVFQMLVKNQERELNSGIWI
jgi:hypothetical protein